MKVETRLLVSTAALLFTAGYARAESTQQEKMKTCNTEATAKGLKGADRKALMKTCLSAGGGEAAAEKQTNRAARDDDGEMQAAQRDLESA